jgi:hypothetical protein
MVILAFISIMKEENYNVSENLLHHSWRLFIIKIKIQLCLQVEVFWIVTLNRIGIRYQRFGGT